VTDYDQEADWISDELATMVQGRTIEELPPGELPIVERKLVEFQKAAKVAVDRLNAALGRTDVAIKKIGARRLATANRRADAAMAGAPTFPLWSGSVPSLPPPTSGLFGSDDPHFGRHAPGACPVCDQGRRHGAVGP
jgi:hypothetical protein